MLPDVEVETAPEDAAADAGDGGKEWLLEPSGELPQLLSQVGLYPVAGDLETVHPRARTYEPRWALWSNGSSKRRYVVLPSRVDTRDPGAWSFAEGTVFFKTFAFEQDALARAVETRVMVRRADRWEFASYRWQDGDAHLLDGTQDVPVEVMADGSSFTHLIPSRLACRACHESARSEVLGFTELQLNHMDREEVSWLSRFGEQLSDAPSAPASIESSDPIEREVLGYLTGNCVHCHNGTDAGPNSVFDLSHSVALGNLINHPIQSSGTAAGTRVVPGFPEESVLFRAISRTGSSDVAVMPPLGVQRVDNMAVDLFRGWIQELSQ